MNQQFVGLLIEESAINSYKQYVQRAKHRAEMATREYDEAVAEYNKMVKVLRNKLDAIYN